MRAVVRPRPITMLPPRLTAILALSLALGTFSVVRLRAGTASVLIHPAEQKQELINDTIGPGSEETPEAQGSCFDKYAWIQPALDTFYQPAWAAANRSSQTSEEALEALRGVMWGKYHPGMDEVVLQRNPSTGRVDMEVVEVSKPNQPHKKRCMLGLLADAVQRHNAELAALLGDRSLRFIVETEDFGVVWRGQNWKLPAFAMCTDHQHSDIPVPDFTWYCYPEARYRNSSWVAVQDLLQRRSDMLGWRERRAALFHRSNWGVGPRKGLMPLLQTYANGSAPLTALEAFGAELDIADTGFVAVAGGQPRARAPAFVWLDEQCGHKYLLHTAGFSYSGGLKYKLACGSIVFKFASKYTEFFEPALQDNVHVVRLAATDNGVDPNVFTSQTAPRIKEVVSRTVGAQEQPPIARQGQAFAREQLTVEALHCYWLGALQRYAELYFLPATPKQLEDEGGGGGGGGGAAAATSGSDAGSVDEGKQRRSLYLSNHP